MGNFYIQLSGPTETESHWWKNLQPGETFTTVPVCVGSTLGKLIPSNTIGRAAEARLRVYAGSEHKHEAQKPTAWEL